MNITTKLDLDQYAWMILKDKVRWFTVRGFSINYEKDTVNSSPSMSIEYIFNETFMGGKFTRKESEVFASKEELIASL